jgi:NAD(P)-dependent dehydrogenase (short-subunit alcohol dehydrogenase family)
MARYELSGKVALVTGGARGIGLETARALAGRSASVAIVDIDAPAAERAAAQVHDSRAVGIGADVTDRGAMQRAVAETVERFGGLDVVVANAGIAPRMATFRAMASESFERVLEVNLMGVCRTVDAALPEIVSRKGHVVVVSSAAAFLNGPGSAPYGMSKAAVEQFGRALRIELVQHGASASVAYFGLINTDMVHESVDRDALAVQMFAIIPRPLRKRLPPAAAGEAIARGIEQRKPRIIRPRLWAIVSVLCRPLNPLIDAGAERDQTAQSLLRQIDARGGDGQPTTA